MTEEKDKKDKRLAYDLITDSLTGPNLRWRDNLLQAVAALLGGLAGGLAGGYYLKLPGAFFGAFGGMILGVFFTGLYLMVYRFFTNMCRLARVPAPEQKATIPISPAQNPHTNPKETQLEMNSDLEHLRLLSIFHYVVGGLAGFFACFPIMHIVMGIVFMVAAGNAESSDDMPPMIIGLIFVVMGSLFVLVGWTLAICMILTGRKLVRQKHYMFCLVVAGVECIFMPFGTVLGIFTIIVLMRDSVKQLFEVGPRDRAPSDFDAGDTA